MYRVVAAALVTNTVLNVALVPAWGAQGAAIGRFRERDRRGRRGLPRIRRRIACAPRRPAAAAGDLLAYVDLAKSLLARRGRVF